MTHHPFKVQGLEGVASEALAQQRLAALPGIKEVHANWLIGEVEVAYDLRAVEEEQVEERLREAGFPPVHSLLQDLKVEWYRYNDRYLREFLSHDSITINRPPAGIGNLLH
ncbi:MAG: hypothetical protein HQL51_11955 [Magnetococcales bacterium]|nr:hypothetical protein [Magnetococcales bacterium]